MITKTKLIEFVKRCPVLMEPQSYEDRSSWEYFVERQKGYEKAENRVVALAKEYGIEVDDSQEQHEQTDDRLLARLLMKIPHVEGVGEGLLDVGIGLHIYVSDGVDRDLIAKAVGDKPHKIIKSGKFYAL